MSSEKIDKTGNEWIAFKIEGNRRLESGDVKGAIELYSAGLKIDPNNPTLLCNRSAAYAKMPHPEWESSYTDAMSAASKEPGMWKAWSRCGFASLAMGKPLRAVDAYRRAAAEFRKANLGAMGDALAGGLKKAVEQAILFLSSGRNAGLIEGPMEKNKGALGLQLVGHDNVLLTCLGTPESNESIGDRLKTGLHSGAFGNLYFILWRRIVWKVCLMSWRTCSMR
jgi:tetratricopeptide (TPR) repeat protein